ncbi:MAG: hypothetical protein IJT43_10890 [Stomatobaculum sp.]|nr:hypothetical protein [Stomatobaculum sp.]
MTKRVIKAALIVFTLLFLLVPATVYADTTCFVTGTKNYLALRTAPYTDERNEIDKLHNGDMFIVTSSGQNGFAYGHTTYGRYGYVNAKYLTTGSYQPQYQYQNQYVPRAGSPRTVVGTTNYLGLRTRPIRDSQYEIGRLYNGETFYVTEWLSSGFAYGYTAYGQYGYVVSSYLR